MNDLFGVCSIVSLITTLYLKESKFPFTFRVSSEPLMTLHYDEEDGGKK